jgi:shikimate kinase
VAHADGRAARAPASGRRGPGSRNVILIGLSGSGKSTVGRLLARRLGWRFVDTDQEIRRRTGLTVEQIFRDRGEAAFRAIEAEIVRASCAGSRQVVATGGGAILDAENRATMLAGNTVVWLESGPEVLAERLSRSVKREPRPLLAGTDLAARLDELGRQRQAHYRCAHHIISTDHRTPRDVADAVLELVRAAR